MEVDLREKGSEKELENKVNQSLARINDIKVSLKIIHGKNIKLKNYYP